MDKLPRIDWITRRGDYSFWISTTVFSVLASSIFLYGQILNKIKVLLLVVQLIFPFHVLYLTRSFKLDARTSQEFYDVTDIFKTIVKNNENNIDTLKKQCEHSFIDFDSMQRSIAFHWIKLINIISCNLWIHYIYFYMPVKQLTSFL